MAYFAYKARNARGDLVEGIQEGADSAAVADMLFNSGMTPVEIAVSARGPDAQQENWLERLQQQPITAVDIMLFSRQMYTLLKSGVPIMRALAGLQESSQNPTFVAMLQDLRESGLSALLVSISPFHNEHIPLDKVTGVMRACEETGVSEYFCSRTIKKGLHRN